MKLIRNLFLSLVIIMVIIFSTSCSLQSKVTFDGENETIVEFGKKLVEPSHEEKEGYDFIGWYNGDTKFNFNSLILEDINLTSKYQIKTYEITFNVDNEYTTINVQYGDKINESDIPTKTGYTIKNWYENDKVFDITEDIKDNHDLIADFEISKYTITYMNESTEFSKSTVEYHKNAENIAGPSKTGYTFLGWYFEGELFNFETEIENDITLEAYYEIRKCKVIFDNDGEKILVEVLYNNKCRELTDFTLAEGGTFLGWYYNDKAFDFDTVIKKDYLIVAKYEFVTFAVTTDINGEKTKYNVRTGKTMDKPKNPKVDGMKFINWYLGEEVFDFSTPITADITLTAKFDYIKHTVTFVNGDSSSTQEVLETYVCVKPMDPVKDNKFFDGWYLDDTKYDFKTPVTDDYVLTAHFSDYKTDKIYVTYDFGYECYQTKEDLRYAYYSEYYNFLKYKGFNFTAKSINNLDKFITDMTNFSYNGRNEMGALGDAFSSLYLDVVKGGTWEDQTTNKFNGYCYQNGKFVDLLYHLQEFFQYWRTDEGYSQGDKNGNDWFASSWASMVDTCKFFYFTSDNIYTKYSWFTSERVHYMLDNIPGVGYRSLIYSSTEAIVLPEDVTRSGYTFLGWYDGNGNKVTTVTKSMTVHAKWATGPVKTMTCLPKAATKGSSSCNYAATPSQTDNSYIYGPRIIIGFNGTNYYVQAILKGDGTPNPSSYSYRIVSYNKSCYTDPSYLIKVGQKVTVQEVDGNLVFSFYENN